MPSRSARLVTKGRRDENEAAIVDALKAAGCFVWRLDGPLDLLVGRHGRFVLLEVKSKSGKLQPKQEQFFGEIDGLKYPAHVVHTPEEALDAVGVKWRGKS